MLTTISAVKWGIGCLTGKAADAGVQQLFSMVGTMQRLRVSTPASIVLRAALLLAADSLIRDDLNCRQVTRIDDAVSLLGRLGPKLGVSAAQAAELHKAVVEVESTIGCAS